MTRYKIFEELGAGGSGQVFKGYDMELERYVAMKRLLTPEEAHQQTPATSVLLREASALAKLRHPHIVSVFGVENLEQGTCIVMELLEGGDLAEWIMREGPLSIEDFQQLAVQTTEALLAANSQNILHRDLKPENVKVSRLPGGRFQAKIIDFGLARLSLAAHRQTQDHQGNIMGSVNYMAPEQIRREEVDGRMDLYALGCVYYYSLTGLKPFYADDVQTILHNHINHRVTPIREHRSDLSAELADWIMGLMAANRQDRPADAEAALSSLRQVLKLTSQAGLATTSASSRVVLPQPVMPARIVAAPPAKPKSVTAPAPRMHPPQQKALAKVASSPVAVKPVTTPQGRQLPWVAIITTAVVLVLGCVAMFWHVTVATTVKLSGQVIGTAGSFRDGGNDITKVFDGNTETYFDANSASGNWVGLDLGEKHPARITHIRYFPRTNMPQRMLKGVFQVSNDRHFVDGVVTLYTIPVPPLELWNEIAVDSQAAYRYVRYVSPDNCWGNVAELEFHGVQE